MNSTSSVIVRNSRLEGPAACLVCGSDIAAREGLTARYGQQTLRFKCPGCLSRFEAAPARYLSDHEAARGNDKESSSPASEWTCDR